METSGTLSAIVVLINDDVHSVYVVPAGEASTENMQRLRTQVRESGIKGIRLQRVLISEADKAVSHVGDVSAQLHQIIINHME